MSTLSPPLRATGKRHDLNSCPFGCSRFGGIWRFGWPGNWKFGACSLGSSMLGGRGRGSDGIWAMGDSTLRPNRLGPSTGSPASAGGLNMLHAFEHEWFEMRVHHVFERRCQSPKCDVGWLVGQNSCR